MSVSRSYVTLLVSRSYVTLSVSRSYVTRLFEVDTDFKNVFTLKETILGGAWNLWLYNLTWTGMAYKSNVNILVHYWGTALSSSRYVWVTILNVDCTRMLHTYVMQHSLKTKILKITSGSTLLLNWVYLPIDINNANATMLLQSLVDCNHGAHHVAYM